MRDLKVTVSGSFHRHLGKVAEAVEAFKARGVRVLSPADPRVVDSIGTFLFVASDRHRSVRLVQDRHLAAISESDFLWLVTVDGYVGQSASLEMGFAVACGTPVLSDHMPEDLTLSKYVLEVKDIDDALRMVSEQPIRLDTASDGDSPNLLLHPEAVIQVAHRELDTIDALLRGERAPIDDASLAALQERTLNLKNLLKVPGNRQ